MGVGGTYISHSTALLASLVVLTITIPALMPVNDEAVLRHEGLIRKGKPLEV